MGNTVVTCWKPAIVVHHEDGSIRYYKPPVCVKDLLTEHPDYFVVLINTKGRTTILSSDLDLKPGVKYYLFSPEHLFSASYDSHVPIDQACSRIYPGCAHLRRVVAICFTSGITLFRQLGPGCPRPKKRRSKKIKLSLVTSKQEDLTVDKQLVHKTALPIKDDDTELPSLAALLSPTSSAAVALTSLESWTSKDMAPGVLTPKSDKTRCSRLLFKLSHLKGTKVVPTRGKRFTSRSSPRKISSGFTLKVRMSTGSDSEKLGIFCIPRKHLKTLEDEASSISRSFLSSFSKERRLKDMIKGADNQWRRLKLEHAFMIEDAEIERQYRDQTKSWRSCLPSPASFGKKYEYPNTVPAFADSKSPSSQSPERSDEYSGVVALQYFQQLQKEDFHGASQSPRLVISAVQSEVEQMERSQLDSRDDESRQTLRLKMDEMERHSLLGSSPYTASSPGNLLQKFAGIDTSSRRRSVNFSPLDRG